jgi:hypothetical protein
MPTRDRCARWIEKDSVAVKVMPQIAGPVNAPSIGEAVGQTHNLDMPMVACSVSPGMERDFPKEFAGNVIDH